LVDFHEIHYGGHVIEDDLGAIIFNPVASDIPRWQTFMLLKLTQNFHQSTRDHEIVRADRVEMISYY
jgi:hypothetical protein